MVDAVGIPSGFTSNGPNGITLNETRICFMFLGWFQVCGCLGDDLLGNGYFAVRAVTFSP